MPIFWLTFEVVGARSNHRAIVKQAPHSPHVALVARVELLFVRKSKPKTRAMTCNFFTSNSYVTQLLYSMSHIYITKGNFSWFKPSRKIEQLNSLPFNKFHRMNEKNMFDCFVVDLCEIL